MTTVGLILVLIGVLLAVFTAQRTAGLCLAIVGVVLLLVGLFAAGGIAL